MSLLYPDRLFPTHSQSRIIARNLYSTIKDLPIISPHGHTDPAWFANNQAFTNPHELLIVPDHYILRMLYSQGISLNEMGISSHDSNQVATPREAWRTFARHFHLFYGTPIAIWLEHTFSEIFRINDPLNETSADDYFDTISELLQLDTFRPRTLLENFNIEFLATTESPLDSLEHHQSLQDSQYKIKIVSTYRPDSVVDPEYPNFHESIKQFGEISGEDVHSWDGYLRAHRKRREDFIRIGATSTDHGHPTARTANLSYTDAVKLYNKIISGNIDSNDAELFRAQMLTEMAYMSLDDGLVMQIHPGSYRNHNNWLFEHYGCDRGADIPISLNYTQALKPLLDSFGNETKLSIILFTLDESNYSRELAPLAGHYPCLRLGPAWWFHDSPEGMMRYREQTTETAGFYNTVGFNDDTRALFSIPARHDMARRVDCAFLARLVSEHRLREEQAVSIAADLAYHIPKTAYRVEHD